MTTSLSHCGAPAVSTFPDDLSSFAPLLAHRDHFVLRILAEDQAAEANLLRNRVAVQLQTNRPGAAQLRLRVFPGGHKLPIDGQADAVTRREDFHFIPVAIVSFLGTAIVLV